MKRKIVWGWLLAASLPVVFSACSDDDPPAKAKVTLPETEARVSESDGTLKSFHPDIGTATGWGTTTGRQVTFKITFDKALSDKVVLAYKLTGTASNVNPTGSQDPNGINVNDYALATSGTGYTLDADNITIEKGVSEVEIAVDVFEDLTLEASDDRYDEGTDSYQETVIFTLKSVVSGPLEFDLTAQPAYTLAIYEDDTFVSLVWDISGAAAGEELDPGDVDLDLYIFLGEDAMNSSTSPGTDYESMFIPAGFADATYDMKYPYYSGTTAVDFYADFINLGGTLNGNTDKVLEFEGRYEVDNVNTYDADLESEEGHENYHGDPRTVQNITKSKLNYPTMTDITVPDQYSRVGESPAPPRPRVSLRSLLRGYDMPKDFLLPSARTLPNKH